jgi:hypothetical protein
MTVFWIIAGAVFLLAGWEMVAVMSLNPAAYFRGCRLVHFQAPLRIDPRTIVVGQTEKTMNSVYRFSDERRCCFRLQFMSMGVPNTPFMLKGTLERGNDSVSVTGRMWLGFPSVLIGGFIFIIGVFILGAFTDESYAKGTFFIAVAAYGVWLGFCGVRYEKKRFRELADELMNHLARSQHKS